MTCPSGRPLKIALRAGGAAIRRKIGGCMMRLWTPFLSAAMLAAAVPAANAQIQNVQEQSPVPSPSQPSQSIPDHKLDATAAALDQIANVKETYTKKIEATPNESDKQQLV